MRICIVGGIYDKDVEYRQKHKYTPETNLEKGLSGRGYEVDAIGHDDLVNFDEYDVVHVHHAGKNALRLAANRGSVSVVFTGHDGSMLCGYNKSVVRRILFNYIVRASDLVIALSVAERAFLSRIAGAGRVEVIGNGMPVGTYMRPASARQAGEAFGLLYVGQLIDLKGVDVMLRAVAALKGRRAIELEIVSQMPRLQQKYEELAAELGIREHVHFTGFLGPEELAQRYGSCDLFVLPSLAESLPSSIFEALLCGAPVVASGVGGIPEQIEGVGLTAPPGDAEGLARAIDAALDNLPQLRASVLDAQTRLRAELSIDRMVDRHLAAYDKAIQRRAARAPRAQPLITPLVNAALRHYS